jgi:hypothetical protein
MGIVGPPASAFGAGVKPPSLAGGGVDDVYVEVVDEHDDWGSVEVSAGGVRWFV